MKTTESTVQFLWNAFQGSLIADALAMPVHWYYDRAALDRDYGRIDQFKPPKSQHPDSILWRSAWDPPRPDLNILHDQAQYWGQKGVHYHQCLKAGENTLNFKLSRELYEWVIQRGGYEPLAWLEHYVKVMCTPDWHRDTYVEEVHRTFFKQYGDGKALMKCAVRDLHIGALASVPALLSALSVVAPHHENAWEEVILTHVSLTHNHPLAETAARQLVRLLLGMAREGFFIAEAVMHLGHECFPLQSFEHWRERPDREVVGTLLTPACYLPDSMMASVYLAWKYEGAPAIGIQANAEVGGDNCHRGAVVGSLLSLKLGAPEFQYNE